MKAGRVHDFMAALFDGTHGFVELRTLGPAEQAFVPVGDWHALEPFVTSRRDRDCYLGVATRVRPDNGSLANCGLASERGSTGRRVMPTGSCSRDAATSRAREPPTPFAVIF